MFFWWPSELNITDIEREKVFYGIYLSIQRFIPRINHKLNIQQRYKRLENYEET